MLCRSYEVLLHRYIAYFGVSYLSWLYIWGSGDGQISQAAFSGLSILDAEFGLRQWEIG